MGGYASGRTPNPCVRCNEHIKYRALLDRLPAFEADYIATGHYARVDGGQGSGVGGQDTAPPSSLLPPPFRLWKAVDASKDQSYVLYMLGQEQLARTLLPLGELTKIEVRAMARELGLDVAAKPDSVEICFVPGNDYRAFLDERLDLAPGEMRDREGNTLGMHRGVAAYTIGQRKGLGLATGQPRYVTAINAAANVVTIGPEEDLFADTVEVSETHWVAGAPPAAGAALEAKPRYKADPAPARLLDAGGNSAVLRFDRPQRALTPGQAIAVYSGDELLGGGTIDRVFRRSEPRPQGSG